MTKNKPFFICIGSQRSATTWIYRTLSFQDDVKLPKIKEIDYFRYLGDHGKGIAWYKSFFENTSINLDITPEYAISPETPQLIYDEMGENVKIVFIIRDPIKRLVSAYQKHQRNGELVCDFEFFLKYNIDSCVTRSLYMPTIERFVKYYEVNVLVFEDMVEQPERWFKQINEVFNMNIDPRLGSKKYNPSVSSKNVIRTSLNKLYRVVRCLPFIRTIKEFFENTEFGNRLLYGGKIDSSQYYEIARQNKDLLAQFNEDRKLLEIYLKRSLSDLWGL